MKDFLITVLPWCITITLACITAVVWLMYVSERKHSASLYSHWEQSTRVNQIDCNHIRALESQLRKTMDDDLGEGWKNL